MASGIFVDSVSDDGMLHKLEKNRRRARIHGPHLAERRSHPKFGFI